MGHHDVMLDSAANFGQHVVSFEGRWIHVEALLANARDLQVRAVVAKTLGDVPTALHLYKRLLCYLQVLDTNELTGFPAGLQTQIAQCTIEQLEATSG